MVKERIRSFFGDLVDNTIDAVDVALDEAEARKNSPAALKDAEQADLPTFAGIPYGEHPHVRERSPLDVSPLPMPALYRRVVAVTSALTTVTLALVYSVPFMAIMQAWSGMVGNPGGEAPLAKFDTRLFVLTFLLVPVLAALVLGQNVGQRIGNILGRFQRNLGVYFVLVGIVGLGILFAAQYVDRLLLDPLSRWLSSDVYEGISTSASIVVALVVVAVGMIHQYARLLLDGSSVSPFGNLAQSILPALAGVILLRLVSISVETGLALVSWGVYALAVGLMLAGFAALLLYRFGRV